MALVVAQLKKRGHVVEGIMELAVNSLMLMNFQRLSLFRDDFPIFRLLSFFSTFFRAFFMKNLQKMRMEVGVSVGAAR